MKSTAFQPGAAAQKSLISASPNRQECARIGVPHAALAAEEENLDCSFAAVTTLHIADADDERAAVTRRLLESLASQLGIRIDKVQVRMDGKNSAANGGGLMDAGIIHLDPLIYDPKSRSGKHLLAHEVAHAAQRMLPPDVMGQTILPIEALRPAAEFEADTVARSFSERHTTAPVRVPLAAEATAALAGFDKNFAELSAITAESHKPEIDKIIDLMSYGLFDWAVTDGDVEEALHILAMSPMLVARAIAANIGAKYRRRLIDNLSPKHYGSHKTEILAVAWAAEGGPDTVPEWDGVEDKILNPLPLRQLDELESAAVEFVVNHSKRVRVALESKPEQASRVREIEAVANSPETRAKLDQAAADALKSEQEESAARKLKLAEMEGLARQITDKLSEWVVTDDEALALLDEIAKQLLKSVEPAPKFRALANTIGDKNLDELIDQIPTGGVYKSEQRRRAFVYLLSMRPPFKNEQIAEDLIDSPWWKFWDAYTSEEAFLAYLLVKSMPQHARNAFFQAHGGSAWSRIMNKLPLNIRESDTLNFYSGGEKDKDRQSILTQLLDDSLWTSAKKDKLRGVIRMANAAGEARFVFNQSAERRADRDPALKDIVREFELYSEADKRTEYKEKPLKGAPFWDEHILGFFGMVGASLDFIFSSDNVDVDTFAIGGEGLNLGEFQDIFGGSFMGARFSRTSKEEREQVNKENEGKIDSEKKNPKNFADVRWNIESGQLKLRADALELDKLAYPSGDMRFTSGKVHFNAVDLYISYMPSAHALRSLDLSVGHADLDGMLLTFADSMVSVNRVSLDGLRVTLKAANKDHLWKSIPGAEGSGMALSNLWSVIMGSASPDLASSLTTPSWAMEMSVDFDSLDLEGLTTSGGQFIQKISIGKAFLYSGGDASSYKQALTESALRMSERIKQERLLANPATDSKGEHKELLERLERQLKKINLEIASNEPAGAVIDVSKVSISGMEGLSQSDKPIELSDIHGQGRSVSAILPLLSDSTTLRNLITGEQSIPSVKTKRPADESFSLDIGSVHAEDLAISGGIPKPGEAQKDYDDFAAKDATLKAKPGYAVILGVLKERVDKAALYGKWSAVGVQNLEPKELGEFKTVRDWLLAFEQKRATVIKELTLKGAAFVVDANGQGGLDADTLLIDNIQSFTPDGSPSLHIGQIKGEQISTRGTLTGGLVNYKEWRSRLEHGELAAKNFSVSDIRNEGTGAAIDSITFESAGDMPGLRATLDRKAGDSTVSIQSGRIAMTGANIPAYSAFLTAELNRLTSIPEKELDVNQHNRIETIRRMLGDLDVIRKRKSAAEEQLALKPVKAAREAAEKELALANKDFVQWERRLRIEKLTIDQLSVSISGLGDVLSETYDFDKAADGMVVTGTGKDQHWFEKAELQGAHTGAGPKDETYVDKATIGPIAGDLKKIPNGWALSKFQVPSIIVSGIRYASGPTSVQATGETTLNDIELDGSVTSDKQGTQVSLTRVKIGSVSARQLRYEDESVVVTITAGEFQTVAVGGMKVTMPEDPAQKTEFEGTISVDRVRKLAVNAAVAGYNVAATVHSDVPEQADPAKAISVKLGKAGIEEVDLSHLSGSADVAKAGTKNKIHINWKYLSASVGHSIKDNGAGDIWDIKRLSLGTITAPKGSHWEADNAVIDILDSVKLNQVFVSARVETGKDEKDQTKVVSAVINGLTVDEIEARQFEVQLKAQPASVDKAGKKKPATDQKKLQLQHGTIRKLKMTGFDLMNRTGKIEVLKDIDIEKLKVTIGDETKGAVQKGTISFHLHGKESETPGMGGRELSAELRKDGATIQIGSMEQLLAEDISGDLTAKMIKTGKVTTGPIDISGNKITVPDIEIASIEATSKAVYNDEKGAKVEVDDAKITGIHLPKLEAEFGDNGLNSIKLGASAKQGSMLIIDEISGNGFFYQGISDLPGKKGTSKTEVRAKKAVLTTFTAVNIERDFIKKITKFEGGLKTAKIDGFSLLLKETIGSAVNSKLLFADVNGAGLRANLSLKDAEAGGKPWVSDISTFELDDLGLTNIAYTQVNAGKVTSIGAQKGKTADASLKGLKTKFTPEGGAFLRFDDLVAHNLEITMPGTNATLNTAELHDFALGVIGKKLDDSQTQMAARLGRFHVEGMWVHFDQERRKLGPAEAAAKAVASKGAPKWMLEPLGDSSADLAITKSPAHIGIPLRKGSINFNDISQPTFGIFASLGVDSRGIYKFQRPHGFNDGKDYLYEPPGGEGLTPETWEDNGPDDSPVITDKGSVNLQVMLEAALNAPASPTPEDPKSLESLNGVGLESKNFKLGGGRLGQGKNFLELDAKDKGSNVFEIDAVSIGSLLTLRAKLFSARQAHFELMGREGKTGNIELQKFRVEIGNLGNKATGTDASGAPIFKFDVTLAAEDGIVNNIEWGDLQILKTDGTGLVERPTPAKGNP